MFFLKLFCTLFYSGLVPKISGTVGSILSFILIYILHIFSQSVGFHVLLFVFIFCISLNFVQQYIEIVKNKDPKEVVIDECLGVYLGYIVLLFFGNFKFSAFFIYLIFFRFFDILKPFPIKKIERKFNNSFGVIIDDIVAALMALILFYAFNSWI
jgi:phosphatidylglycerophosphatase A